MSTVTKEVIDLIEILPESEQNFALEFIKKLVFAWPRLYQSYTSRKKRTWRNRKRYCRKRNYFTWCYQLGLKVGRN